MKRFLCFVAIAYCTILPSGVRAQEHYTEGNVREVSFYRTKPGQFDEYMKYLRANFLPLSASFPTCRAKERKITTS